MKVIRLIMYCLFILPLSLIAHDRDTLKGSSTWRFTENKGQWESNIKYKAQIRNGAFFLEQNKLTIVVKDQTAINRLVQFKNTSSYMRPTTPPIDNTVNVHAFQMEFDGANRACNLTPQTAFPDYENYFIGNNPSQWASRINAYQAVYYNDLYPGIDLKVYSNDHRFKYDFIIAPDIDYRQIKINYIGTNGLSISKGNLIIKTSITDFVELKPYAYQIIDNKEIAINCDFEINRNTVRYIVGEYDHSFPLVIDPTLVFATYSGSTADNWGYTATYDQLGNMYSGGSVFGTGYPTTIGAFQTTYGLGSCDISITKFNTTGNSLIFSSYLGGNGSEVPNSLITNNNNELFVLGTSGSANFPTTAGCFDNTFNGGTPYVLTSMLQYPNGSDIVLSKFSTDGTLLLGSTYYGGSGIDGLNSVDTLKMNYADDVRGEVMIDEQSNVYVVSSTRSNDLPVSAGAFQPASGGGLQDGIILKMNQNLTNIIWASYLGGSKNDACYSIQIDRHNNIYVAGGTNSLDFPTTQGVVHPTYLGGVCDGFISLINENGTSILASSYFGSSAYDQIYLTKTDRQTNVFLFGQTAATGNTLIQNAAWNMPNGGQFLTKLTSNLQNVTWSTTFGTGNGGPDISPTALLVDYCNNIYMSGWGGAQLNGFGGTTGMPITTGAFQPTTDNHDYYFIVVKDDASALQYATFFGGPLSKEHVDGGTSRFDKKGRIYQAVCAGCGNHDDFPTTPGAWSQTNNSFNCNMGVIKFDFDIPALIADFDIPNIVCAPVTIPFTNNSSTASIGTTLWNWDFGDGTTSTAQSPTHNYSESGQYNVRLIVSNSISCNLADTLTKTIIVLSNTKDTLADKHLCLGDFIQLGIPPSNNSSITYNWQPATNLSNTTISNPIATPVITTNYLLKISDGICIDTLMQKVNVYDLQIEAGNNITVCRGDSANLSPTTSGGATAFYWSTNPNFTPILNNNISTPNFKPVVNQSATYYVKAQNDFCETIDSITVTMSFADISATSPFTICNEDTITLQSTNNTPSDTIQYQWTPAEGIISGSNTASPIVCPMNSTTFIVTGTNSNGCKDTANVKVNVIRIASQTNTTNVRCHGSCNGILDIEPSAGQPPYSFHWDHNPSLTENIASSLCPGNYRAMITDQHGCKLAVNETITQPDSISINHIDTTHVVCNGICSGMARIGATGGTPPYQYTWVNGSNRDSIHNVCAGIYTFTITDFNLCTKKDSILISDTSSFDAIVSQKAIRCYSECNGEASVIASGGQPPYSFIWNGGANNDTLFNLCSGIYSATIRESNGCIRSIYAEITEPTPISMTHHSIVIPHCTGDTTGQISVTLNGGVKPYQFIWSGIPSADSSLINLKSGTYPLNIIDANGCTYDTTFILSQPDPLLISVTPTKTPCVEICEGAAEISISGGIPPYTILWDNGQHNMQATQLCFGNHTVSITDNHQCTLVIPFMVSDTSYFPSSISAWVTPDTIYQSQTIQLNATEINGFTYNWTPSEGIANTRMPSTTATPDGPTEYIVHVYDLYGCEKSDTVSVYVKEVICDEPFIYVPNAFTPNIDQKNDLMFVRSEIISDLYFAIYDRWGEKIFETTDQNKGWDGSYKERKCDPAVYVYYIEATCITKDKYIKKGNITLIR